MDQQTKLLASKLEETEKELKVVTKEKRHLEVQVQYDIFAYEAEMNEEQKDVILDKMKQYEDAGILVDENFGRDYTKMINDCYAGGFGIVSVVKKINPKTEIDKQTKAIKTVFFDCGEAMNFFKDVDFPTTLNHPNIIKIEKIFFGYHSDKDKKFSINIVMPFIKFSFISWMLQSKDHQTSFERIPKNKKSFEKIGKILIRGMEGLNYIHENNIVHMDVKFDNFLVDENENCIITDFGVSLKMDAKTHTIAITPEFAAPEVENLRKSHDFSPKCDIFSFGVMLFKLFVLEKKGIENIDPNLVTEQTVNERISKLYLKEECTTVAPEIVKDLVSIIKNCLELNPQDRPTAQQLLEHKFFKY